ncbi:MAG: T9SS type A sorting domain-containing protein [Saprospiraceae bacterium]
MKNKLTFFFLLFFFSSSVFSQTYTPGETYFGENEYIEFKAGNLPIIISAPHGGGLEPTDIPDRDCTGCVYVRDSRTQELIRQMSDAIFEEFGCYPYIIINRLHRKKLDANRDIGDAADGDPMAEQAWMEFHDYIQIAKDSITQNFGKGLYLDLHGHGHDIQRLELGYRISKSELQMTDLELDAFVDDASIKNLVNSNLDNLTLSQFLRGEDSFGEYYEEENFPAVPSQTDPSPIGTDPYFNGGYNTERHGSKLEGVIDGIQIECNWDDVRNTEANRDVFAAATAQVLRKYLERHYFGNNFLTSACGLVSSSNILGKNKFPSFRTSPNPANDQLNLKWETPFPSNFSISIFNKLGQVFYLNNEGKTDLGFINISHLPNGIFFIKIENEDFVSLEKFIKID